MSADMVINCVLVFVVDVDNKRCVFCPCPGSGPARRHADGTYTSDVSSYLQDQAAKDFITWLKSGQPKPE